MKKLSYDSAEKPWDNYHNIWEKLDINNNQE